MSLFDWVSSPYVKSMPDNYQDIYRRALLNQWSIDCEAIRAIGITPPWRKEPDDLRKDEYRLIAACADHGGVLWADNNADLCLTTTRGIGLRAIGNAKAVIAKCQDLGYITCMFNGENFTINATPLGMNMLEDYEDQKEAGIL
jgi:hypothetical protein